MKSICYQVFQTLFVQNRCLVMMVFLSLNILGVYGNTYYRPKVEVNANPTGAGNVYVSRTQGDKTSQTAVGDYGDNGKKDKTSTFYFSADHIGEDYLWYAWISQNGTVALTQKNAPLDLSVNSEDTYGADNNTTDKTEGDDNWYSYLFHFTAKWVQPDVTGVTNGTANGTRQSTYDLGTLTDPTATTTDVAFTLSNDYAGLLDINDVCPDYYSVATPLASNGYTNGNISHTKGSGSLTVPVIYTPTGIHGQTNSASLTVKSNYPSAGTNCWTAVFSVAENYKPEFSLSTTNYNFTPNYPIDNSTSSSAYTLPITGRNYAAFNIAEWDVSWGTVTYEGGTYPNANPYSLDVTDINNPKVIFTAPATGSYTDVTVTLTITAKYEDANRTLIASDAKTITFSADAGNILKIGDLSAYTMDFGIVDFGTEVSKEVALISTYSDLTETRSNEVDGITFTPDYANDKITVSIANTTAIGSHTPSLTLKAGTKASAVLNVTAQVRLAKPELEANGDVNSVLLEWNEINGATKYIIKSAATVVETLTAIEAEEANYKYKVTTIGGTPVVAGQSYSFTVTAVYGDDASILEKISVSDEKTASPSECPYTITTDNASKDKLGMATGLKNGLKVNGIDAKYNPSKAQWDVDVTSTFDANGNALFDRLYIFGLTTGPIGSSTVQGYANSGATMPNAITPCYIYEKRTDGKAYEHKATIDNMNTDTKNSTWFNVSLSSNEKKKIYLTGWCPYGSTGVTINEHGLLYVTGNNNNQIDIYLEDCYLYSRVHKRDNSTTWGKLNFEKDAYEYSGLRLVSALALMSEDGYDYGAKGAASAIVIEATGNTAFPANIHIKGDNLVFGHMGASFAIKADLSSFGYGNMDEAMGQYSAPIYVRPQDKNKTTTLTMDDKWPTDASDPTKYVHTNGYMKLEKYLPAGPSIDLGNKNTTLNFNGGRFELEASLPTQANYPNNLAICVRNGEFLYDGLPDGVQAYVCYGMAGDATGGTVNLNDGSVWVTKFTPAIKQWSGTPVDNSDFFDDIYTEGGVEYSNTLRLPGKTYVHGGSHKGYIRACTELLSSGSTPTDGYSYLEQRVYEVNDAEIENGFVKEAYFTNANPAGLYKRERVTPSTDGATEMLLETYYQTYTSYYSSQGGSYGRAAISPEVEKDGKKRIYLWVPGKAKHPITFTNWHLSTPYVKADLGALGALANGMNIEFGTETEVPYEKYEGGEDKHVVKNLWRVEMDENIVKAATVVGKVPAKVAAEYVFVDLDDSSFPSEELYRDISNETDYVIKNSLYSFQTIQADDWMLFCPQFDVKNIYILEICDENFLKTLSESDGRDEALLAQAVLNLDMTALIGIDISAATNDKPFWDYYARYSEYVNHIKNFTGDDSDIEMRKPFYQNYNPALNSMRTKLQHLVKKGDGSFNYSDAHYYLYQTDATDWWIDTETEILKINWELAPAAENNDGLVMKKGQVYAMQFPYCPGCNDGTEWDYWTGKVIVLEGEGPQTLNGSNVHSTIKATTEGGFHGNYTFKDISLEESEMIDAYFNVAGYMFDKESSGVTSLPAGESFVILPSSVYSSMPGKRVKSIDPQSGVITWEEDNSNDGTTTGTPTISGNRQMMVYTIDGGVGIIPVTAQEVSIYNAAGQLVTAQYLTEETHIPLSTGIYLICGANERAKAVVR